MARKWRWTKSDVGSASACGLLSAVRKMLNTPPVPHVQQTDRENLLKTSRERIARAKARKKAK